MGLTYIIRTPNNHNPRLNPRLRKQNLPRRMPPETNPQHQIPLNARHRARKVLGDITPHMINEQGHIHRRAIVDAKHVLSVPRVSIAPGIVAHRVNEAGTVVALVEG